MAVDQATTERFWRRVARSADDQCWRWLGDAHVRSARWIDDWGAWEATDNSDRIKGATHWRALEPPR
jgi:hypothetical protein